MLGTAATIVTIAQCLVKGAARLIPSQAVTGPPFRTLAVVGAGNMGSGIAQKMAAEGFDVVLVDLDEARVARGIRTIQDTLAQAVARRLVDGPGADAIVARVRGTARFDDLSGADLVVEAVFEDLAVKRDVFTRLDRVCRPDAILATNTSSFSVHDIASNTGRPERVLGLHYFYHPAKNRLVEVVPARETDPAVVRRAWELQEVLGKTPIVSADACGFIVNRFFLPWLTEAVRMLESRDAEAPTIDAAAKQAFGIGMGPFELMNVTGVPIALHAAGTLGRAFGDLYAAPGLLRRQAESGRPWDLTGSADASRFETIADRLLAVTFFVAGAIVDEQVGTIEDVDIGARVGLRWRRGPFELMNDLGVDRSVRLAESVSREWDMPLPRTLAAQRKAGAPFAFRFVRSDVRDRIATLTIDRPDAMNALNEAVFDQLDAAFQRAAADSGVDAIVIAGSGKAFVAGADIRFFVRNIEAGAFDRIEQFTERGQRLLQDIDACRKPVVARVHGPALGGGVELALACDYIVATPRASFAFPETGIGIYPGLGGTQRTTRRIGRGLAKWLVLTGETIQADEALAIGLVDRVVAHHQIEHAIRELASRGPQDDRELPRVPDSHRALAEFFASFDIASMSGEAVASQDSRVTAAVRRLRSKAPLASARAAELIDRAETTALAEGLRLELAHVKEIFSTEDAYEGLASLGTRRPVFKGR
jgi:enoyl-CoA hydratase/3-hydroxyacyl-CoA dehydrogenase